MLSATYERSQDKRKKDKKREPHPSRSTEMRKRNVEIVQPDLT